MTMAMVGVGVGVVDCCSLSSLVHCSMVGEEDERQ